MMGFGLFTTVLIVGAVIYLLSERSKESGHFNSASNDKTALDIAKERYARGEIDKREFDEIRADLH